MGKRKMEPKLLENSNCGAFLAGTGLQSVDNEKVEISEATKRDYLITSDECHFLIKNIWRRKASIYYIIVAANGNTLKVTGQQSILTGTGWKRAKNLCVGDMLLCYDFFEGRQYVALLSIEKVVAGEQIVYSVSMGSRTLIANGFVCSDYDMQQGS